jgi:hypothetical protein
VKRPRPVRSRSATPKRESMIRQMEKTPALTTTTAWSSALTGVGATMASGSQLWSGMIPALAKPKRKRR